MMLSCGCLLPDLDDAVSGGGHNETLRSTAHGQITDPIDVSRRRLLWSRTRDLFGSHPDHFSAGNYPIQIRRVGSLRLGHLLLDDVNAINQTTAAEKKHINNNNCNLPAQK